MPVSLVADMVGAKLMVVVAAGAQAILDESAFPEAKEGTSLVGPVVLVNVDHSELPCVFSSRTQLM
jgi:pseudouridine-5'-phosphate glycosidase